MEKIEEGMISPTPMSLINSNFMESPGDFVIKEEPTFIPDYEDVPESEIDINFSASKENTGINNINEKCQSNAREFQNILIDDENLLEINEIETSNSSWTFQENNEQKMQELMIFYQQKYQLNEVSVTLECCDKIWKTMQLIKNAQYHSKDENESFQPNQKENFANYIKIHSIPRLKKKNLPEYRYEIKGRRKTYFCRTCNLKFVNSELIKQHGKKVHSVYYKPKRVYNLTMRYSKLNQSNSQAKSNNSISNVKIPTVTSLSQSSLLNSKPEKKNIEVANKLSNGKKLEKQNEVLNKKEDTKEKVIADKVECILCKKITSDIYNHMKGYHKVGCISSIISQCPKVKNEEFKANNTIKCDLPEKDNNNLEVKIASKKRKRKFTRWTPKKKKFKTDNSNSLPVNNVPEGPFKCNICFGVYKSTKTFKYHSKLHRIRGDTRENFDSSTCRFKNSPLKYSKEKAKNKILPMKSKSENFKSPNQTLNSNATSPVLHNADTNQYETTICDCGRSFRNYHTLYLHKVKCKQHYEEKNQFANLGIGNDGESDNGINIKIKKNENDSYEVISKTNNSHDLLDSIKGIKDGDSSSNDSGTASTDQSVSQKNDAQSVSSPNHDHSILRIQVAEDDEDVDIEDDFDESIPLLTDSTDQNKSDQNNSIIDETKILKNNSLINGGIEVDEATAFSLKDSNLNKSLEKATAHKCLTCSLCFKDAISLTEHAIAAKHNIINICTCDKKFKSLKFFNIHIRQYHPSFLKCSYCKTNFDKVENFIMHKCEITQGKSFIEPIIQATCYICQEVLDIGEPFDNHVKIKHVTESNVFYQCFKCEKRFENANLRKLHFNKEHGHYFCQICNRRLHIDHLAKHEAYHEGLGYPCHVCKKAFSQKNILNKHKSHAHSAEVHEMVKCNICEKSVKLKLLKKHISFHLHAEICRKCNKCDENNDNIKLKDDINN